MSVLCAHLVLLGAALQSQADRNPAERTFYVFASPQYTITDSVVDSVRFTLNKTLQRDKRGHLASISSFVDPEGRVMGWHDFGNLEGPGWAANAVGGAYEIHALGRFLQKPLWQTKALSILDHVLEGGFIDGQTGFIRGYRETTTDKFCLNYTHNSDWFCPGSMAKVAYQLLLFADELGDDPRAERMRAAAVRCAAWIQRHVEPVANGWFPRRTTPDGKVYRKSPTGGDDPFWQTSADGLFILQLQAALTRRGLADYRESLKEKTAVFMAAGGIFGSINHDTYDPHENVAYSVAFRTLLPISELLADDRIRTFAYEKCLAGLDQFKMHEDRNGVATKGLLYMEKSWDTSYLWENAEAALAYFEAAVDSRPRDSAKARGYEIDGLVILRAAAKHHHGPHGFLTEGVDWNNHVGQKHHIDQARFGAIQYTEPFLNNQHIVEPTLYYLEHLARKSANASTTEWRDLEDNVILCIPPPRRDTSPTATNPYATWQNGPSPSPEFFPLAVWLQAPKNAPKYQAIGINLYIGLWKGPTEAQLAELKRHGMPVICAQNQYALEHLDEKIIVGWMHGDEPDNAQSLGQGKGYGPPIPPRKIVEDYDEIRQRDPTRPVVLNLGQGVAWDGWHGRGVRTNHPEDYPKYVAGGDVISFDIYPVVHGKPAVAGKLWYVPRGVDRLRKWTRDRKIVWNCIECTHIGNPDRKPTPQQVKAEVWMSILHGSQGIIYFCHEFQPRFIEAGLLADQEIAEAVGAMNRQIHSLAPVLHSPTVEDAATVQSDPADVSPDLAAALGSAPVAVMVKRHSGATYLFAVRMEQGPSTRRKPTTATFQLQGLRGKTTAEAIGENRTVQVENGTFADDFGPYEVHLYKIR